MTWCSCDAQSCLRSPVARSVMLRPSSSITNTN